MWHDRRYRSNLLKKGLGATEFSKITRFCSAASGLAQNSRRHVNPWSAVCYCSCQFRGHAPGYVWHCCLVSHETANFLLIRCWPVFFPWRRYVVDNWYIAPPSQRIIFGFDFELFCDSFGLSYGLFCVFLNLYWIA